MSDPFGPPVAQTLVNTSHLEWMPALSSDGEELFFASERPTSLSQDLFRSTFDPLTGAYGAPQSVTALNTVYWETGPGLSWDALTLYFSSPMPGGVGSMDIYSVKRATRQSAWGPIQLEPSVNSVSQDELPKEDPSGKRLLFCSNRAGNGVVFPESYALFGATRLPGGWSSPVLLQIDQPAGVGGWSPTILSDGSLLFASMRAGGKGDGDLYLAPPIRCGQ